VVYLTPAPPAPPAVASPRRRMVLPAGIATAPPKVSAYVDLQALEADGGGATGARACPGVSSTGTGAGEGLSRPQHAFLNVTDLGHPIDAFGTGRYRHGDKWVGRRI